MRRIAHSLVLISLTACGVAHTREHPPIDLSKCAKACATDQSAKEDSRVEHVIDGDLKTYWHGAGQRLSEVPSNIIVIFDEPQTIRRIDVTSQVFKNMLRLKDFELYARAGDGWAGGEPLAAVKGFTKEAKNMAPVTATCEFGPVTCRAVRLRIRATWRPDNAWPRICEIQAWTADEPGRVLTAGPVPEERECERVLCGVAMGLREPVPDVNVLQMPDYLAVVKAYADRLIEYGRDGIGRQKSPLFAAALDRRLMMFGPMPSIPGIRGGDRTLSGANPMHDQNLYQVLYALALATGDRRYAAAADEALKWFFEHCQSEATGLFAWGEHLGWDFIREAPAGDIHEFYRPWVLWDRTVELAPGAMAEFAAGLWHHQIHDQKTGEFSRHARWARHGTGGDNEYPRHGGFYISTWARAYGRTKDPIYVTAIETLLNYYDLLSSKVTGAIPCSSNAARAKVMWPPSNLSLAIDLWDHADLMPASLAAKMRARAKKTDDVYLRLEHNVTPEGYGFVSGAHIDTLKRFADGKWTHTRPWATGYGKATDAQTAMLCYLRYRQMELDGYRTLILGAAARYLDSEPDTQIAVYPGAMGDVIFLLLAAHEITERREYVERADHFAQLALKLFFGRSPLPKASTRHEHYEAITRGDTLMMGLLKLWQVKTKPDLALRLVYCDR